MKKQAFLIGINQYYSLPELKFARQDAEAIEQALKQNYSFSDDEIMLLTDAKPGLFKPFNRQIIEKHLEKLANKELDLFIFGFWGHGLFRNGHRYFCPMDSISDDIEELGMSFDSLQRTLSNIKAKNTCLILDCCQKVHDRGESETLTAADQTIIENAARDIVLRRKEEEPEFDSNVAILNSCKEGQSAYEWDKREHGIFTAHLLDAMNKHYESIAQIVGYISKAVEKTAMELGKTQTPFYKLEGDISLPVNAELATDASNGVPSVALQAPKPSPTTFSNPLSDLLNEAAQEKQKNLYQLQKDAAAAYKNNEFAAAISKLKEVLKLDPNAKEAQDLLSICEQKISQLYLTGKRYYEGDGVPKDYAEAVKWFRKAAELGNAKAQYSLAWCYTDGEGVPQDKTEAEKWFQKAVISLHEAAKEGNAEAQYKLGECFNFGYGVPENKSEAVKWYRLAAEQGEVNAQFQLGCCYDFGNGVPENKSEAVKWYRLAAEQGDSIAQCNLGFCYCYGEGVPQDYTEAVKWFRLAAEQGDTKAQFNLGNCYYNGDGVPQDYTEAVKWYRLAAEQGNAEAQYAFGNCCDNGDGVPQDKTEAVKWYRLAAEQGNAEAQFMLGYCYDFGDG
ncbi:MAG: SEL1-like repeat protein, partial [Thermoguttaceae bacterium]|nr:SEL1-like repeat protein [Thermoguttaceae bacterium]